MRNIVLTAAVVAAALAAWFWARAEAPAPPVMPRVEAPPPAVEVKPPALQPPPPAPAPLPVVPPNAGFCSAEDGPSTVLIRHTLEGLLRKLGDSGDPELAAAVRAARDEDEPWRRPDQLRRARKLKPSDPAIGWEIAALTRYSPDVDEAVDGLAAYVAADPNPDLMRVRALLEVQRDIQKEYARSEHGGTTVLWPRDLLTASQADQLLYEVNRSLDDAARLTGTRRRDQLTVVVYPSRSELLAVTCVRSWTAGVYDGTLRLTAPIETKVLQHETLHAQASRHASRAPRGFHDGLAQSFAKQSERKSRWALMVKNRTYVPFSSLDGSFQAFEASDDAALAYTQSYAMVELMRDCGGDGAIPRAIDAFQRGEGTEGVLMQACGRPVSGNDLIDFMSKRL
jgi:hypothetical protein